MSTDSYRVDVAAAMYASQLKKICGEGGTGGIVDFPVKKRPPRSGGDWDFAASAERRPLNKDAHHVLCAMRLCSFACTVLLSGDPVCASVPKVVKLIVA